MYSLKQMLSTRTNNMYAKSHYIYITTIREVALTNDMFSVKSLFSSMACDVFLVSRCLSKTLLVCKFSRTRFELRQRTSTLNDNIRTKNRIVRSRPRVWNYRERLSPSRQVSMENIQRQRFLISAESRRYRVAERAGPSDVMRHVQ